MARRQSWSIFNIFMHRLDTHEANRNFCNYNVGMKSRKFFTLHCGYRVVVEIGENRVSLKGHAGGHGCASGLRGVPLFRSTLALLKNATTEAETLPGAPGAAVHGGSSEA